MRSFPFVLPFVVAIAAVAVGRETPVQSQSSFEAAIKNRSTARSYVLITIVDDRAGSQHSIWLSPSNGQIDAYPECYAAPAAGV